MKRLHGLWILVAAACFTVGCGDGSDPSSASPSPVQSCEDLVQVTCERMEQCAQLPVDQCKCAVKQKVDCSKIVGVSKSYDACLAQLRSMACEQLLPNGKLDMPPVCHGVLLTLGAEPGVPGLEAQ